jgi:hypothetical protein
MSKKQETYINEDLEWLESKALDLRDYVDANPFSTLKDRITYKELKNGGVLPITSATIEQQLSALTKALKEYAEIMRVVKELREQEAKKQELRKGFNNKNILDE